MIVWKLMNVLSGEKELINQLNGYIHKIDLSDSIVINLLSQSNERFSVCLDGNLRAQQINYSFDIGVKEELSAVEAFQRYGGDALSEVIDYGSYKIV